MFVTTNADVARFWIASELPDTIIKQLKSYEIAFNAVVPDTQNCLANKAVVWTAAIPVIAAGIELAITGALALADLATAKVTGTSPVAAPPALLDALLVGIYATSYNNTQLGTALLMTTRGPLPSEKNTVTLALQDATKSGDMAAKNLAALKTSYPIKAGEEKKVAGCFEQAGEKLKAPTEKLNDLAKTSGDGILGSRIDQAVRAAAAIEANMTAVAILTPVSAGGAAASIQPSWLRSPKLVTGADLALAYRLQSPTTGEILTSGYYTKGCGRVITVGDNYAGTYPTGC